VCDKKVDAFVGDDGFLLHPPALFAEEVGKQALELALVAREGRARFVYDPQVVEIEI